MTLSCSWTTSYRSTGRWQSEAVFDVELMDRRPGSVCFRVAGPGAEKVFANEAGGHRWQRVPPTERHGRRQTSTITVAVLPELEESEVSVPEKELEWTTTTSRGNGGQSVNTTMSCVVLKHLPSGITVRCQNERSQFQNKRFALQVLRAKLQAASDSAAHTVRAEDRRRQVGCGERGDKGKNILDNSTQFIYTCLT